MGDATSGPVRLSFHPQLPVEFRVATVTSDAGHLLPRELDERLSLRGPIERHLSDPRLQVLLGCIIGSPGKELFLALFVGDLGGDVLNCVEMQLLFGAAFPLPCLVRINATIERPLDLYPTGGR